MTAFGSPPLATTAASSSMRLRSRITPRSLSPRCSFVRSAIAPWPTHATKSWFMMWLVMKRPLAGSVIGPCQYGIWACSNGASPGTASLNHATCSVRASSIGTRHSNFPVYKQFGQRHTRPTVHSSSSSVVSSRTRR